MNILQFFFIKYTSKLLIKAIQENLIDKSVSEITDLNNPSAAQTPHFPKIWEISITN